MPRYLCDRCGKSYKHKRNLKRHTKEHHSGTEHWNCVESSCASKFIRRSYLSRHLVWVHGYNKSDAIEATLNARRGDVPQQISEYEMVSDDDTILDLLEERENMVTVQGYCDTVGDFELNMLDEGTSDVVEDCLEGDIDVEVLEPVSDNQLPDSEAANANDISVVGEVVADNGEDDVGENGADVDGDRVSGDEVAAASDAGSVIVISSDEDETVAMDNSYVVDDMFVGAVLRRRWYVDNRLVYSNVTCFQQYHQW